MADDMKVWQEALDRLAYFNLLAIPDSTRPNEPSYRNGKLTEVLFHGAAHRFDVAAGQLDGRQGYRTSNTVGTEAGPFEFRWAPIPDDFSLVAGRAVPPTPFEPAHAQRIAVTGAEFAIGEGGQDRVEGFGTGRTYPIHRAGGQQLTRIAASGVITAGRGALANNAGMFALSGLFTPPDDFQLNILVMIKDPGALYVTSELPAIEPVKGLPRSSTFLHFSTFVPAVTSTTIVPGKTPAAPPASLTVSEKLRLCATSFSGRGPQGLASRYKIGPTAGDHLLTLKFSPTSGSATTPDDPSAAYDVEQFQLYGGSRQAGTLKVENDEIRAILTPLDGVPQDMVTQMFAGFGPVNGGDGTFVGAQGFQINLGVGTFVPHLTSILNLVELADPTGRFRS